MMEIATFKIEGTCPLLMHNGQLADPMNEHTRALSDATKAFKKTKTEALYAAVCEAEFRGGLYVGEDGSPCLPGELIEAVICEGAKKTKQGKEVKAGLIVDGNFALEYKGPRTVEKLWKGKFYKVCGVRVGQNRVMRTRPMFQNWSCTFNVHYNPELINLSDLRKFIAKAGAEVGIGDFRPRYGRFQVAA